MLFHPGPPGSLAQTIGWMGSIFFLLGCPALLEMMEALVAFDLQQRSPWSTAPVGSTNRAGGTLVPSDTVGMSAWPRGSGGGALTKHARSPEFDPQHCINPARQPRPVTPSILEEEAGELDVQGHRLLPRGSSKAKLEVLVI